jgi:hypothetical protein
MRKHIDLLEGEIIVQLQNVGQSWFDMIMGLPPDIRQDDKERPGISVLIQEPETRNLLKFRVGKPLPLADYLADEKAVRSNLLKHASSQNSANPSLLRFPGSLTACFDGVTLQASISGAKGEEDAFISAMLLASAFHRPIEAVLRNIKNLGGELPAQFFQKDHYLYILLNS